MRNLLFGVILGLLAVVHSTPIDTVTQIPTKPEDEVMREAVTDGFLVELFSHPSLTTESPKGNTTVQASRQPSSVSTDMTEGSAGETSDASTTSVSFKFSSTTLAASHAESSTSTVVPGDTDDSSSDPSRTQSPQSSFTTSVPNKAQSSVTPDHISASQTTDPAVYSFHFLSTQSLDSGSGDGEMLGQYSTTTSSTTSSSSTEASTASSTSTADFIKSLTSARSEGSSEGSGEGSGLGMEFSAVPTNVEREIRVLDASNIGVVAQEPQSGKVEKPEQVGPAEPQNKGHSTPGWIIILGFIVGLAALIMLCVAIATRDKWNGPSQASQQKTKTNTSNQQRGLEMETFLHKDSPKENGKAAEYTVIPLDELPEKYSSH